MRLCCSQTHEDRVSRVEAQIIHIYFEIAMHNILKPAFLEANIKMLQIPSGTGLVVQNKTLGLSQDWQGQQYEIGKWLKGSFGSTSCVLLM